MNIQSQAQTVGIMTNAIQTAMSNANYTAAQSLFGHLRKAIFPYECVQHDKEGEIIVEGWLGTEDLLRKQYTDQILGFQLGSGLWIENDGGRKAAGFDGSAGDCCVRAISIAMKKDYKEVWDFFNQLSGVSPDIGVSDIHICNYVENAGWKRRFYREGETQVIDAIPEKGLGIVWCKFLDGLHCIASIDGKIHDTYNSLGFEVLWVATPADDDDDEA